MFSEWLLKLFLGLDLAIGIALATIIIMSVEGHKDWKSNVCKSESTLQF